MAARSKPTPNWFQFHSGTIKRNTHFCALDEYYRFQFHSGTIKSADGERDEIDRERSFNSILVRLKDFTIVAILLVLIRFQFHSGTIKSAR